MTSAHRQVSDLSSLWIVSATQLAAMIARGEVSAAEVVRAHIDRAEFVNPAINALVACRFDEAMAEAQAADLFRATGAKLPPLHGVPITIKEFVAVRGMPHSGGVKSRAGERAGADATATTRLRAAGAIVLGVTNGPEGGLWHETHNTVYGRTRNPHDLYRTPGGSSGGEAALLAAGGTAFGLGSDTGGSVRIPATLCGVVGFKPTGGSIPNTGHFPDAPRSPVPMMSLGPMARTVDDAWLGFRILAGADGIDHQAIDHVIGDPLSVRPADVTVYVPGRLQRGFASADVENGLQAALTELRAAGCQVRPLTTGSLWRVALTWSGLLAESGDTYQDTVGRGQPVLWVRQALRWFRGSSDHTGGVLAVLALERLQALLPKSSGQFAAAASALTVALEAELGPMGVIVLPGWNRTAPLHRGMAVMSPLAVGTTALFNVTSMPAIAVPFGQDRYGLPLGAQVAAARRRDHVAVAVARWLEASAPPFRPLDPTWGRAGPLGLKWLMGDGPARLSAAP